MYGYRYHLTTIIAVFMALGIGILLGGSAGQELFPKEQLSLMNRLEEKYNAARAENVKYNRKVTELMRQTSQLDHALGQLANSYMKQKLTGKKIVLIQMEKGDPARVADWLQSSGAQVQAVIRVKDPELVLDAASLPVLAQGLGLPGETNGTMVLAHSAKSLADSIAGISIANWPGILKEKGWIDIQGHLGTPPDAVLLLSGPGRSPQLRLQLFDVPLIKEILKQNLRVIGTERTDNEISAIPAYRNLGISTVDNLDQASGLLAAAELISGKEGNFGIKPTAQSLLPMWDNQPIGASAGGD
ncbi:copper transporter [Effusibacillus lacus]|uniref:Copper transporter n=1 Tax=Effusibacillus lacus TaxID=1348429 RepID=A0A292YTT4_9BACL|nr:copper transporter [Effusibacillus lacus]TCS76358.1 copper transport outer membrane protein MctB [Effusibacillus lacus]GAX91900.1 hypothetical protein EFBL_3591 [Effusibacillus lacus]